MAKIEYLGACDDHQDIGNKFGNADGAFWHGGANMSSIWSVIGKGMIVAGLLMSAGPALAAGSDDGFAAFWTQFDAAIRKSDQKAVSQMVKYPIYYDDRQLQMADFPVIWKGSFDRAERACLAKEKPVKDTNEGQVTYNAVCDETIYVFGKDDVGWKLIDFAVND